MPVVTTLSISATGQVAASSLGCGMEAVPKLGPARYDSISRVVATASSRVHCVPSESSTVLHKVHDKE